MKVLVLGSLFLLSSMRAVTASTVSLPPMKYTVFCMRYPDDCLPRNGTGARRQNLEDLQAVNAAANALIEPDLHSDDQWDIYPSRGNCADYAVSKRHTLLNIGWPSHRLLLAEVALRDTGEHHLVLIVFAASKAWILDNRFSSLLTLEQMNRHYKFVRAAIPDNPKIWQASLPKG